MSQFSLTSIPWYRTRKFWAVVFGLMLSFSLFVFIQFLDKNGGNYQYSQIQILNSIYSSTGGAFFVMFGFKLGGLIGSLIGVSLYYIVQTYLIYKTFCKYKVSIKYPIIFIAIYVAGIITAMALGSF